MFDRWLLRHFTLRCVSQTDTRHCTTNYLSHRHNYRKRPSAWPRVFLRKFCRQTGAMTQMTSWSMQSQQVWRPQFLPKGIAGNSANTTSISIKLRHLVENCFLSLKRWRRIAARYAKTLMRLLLRRRFVVSLFALPFVLDSCRCYLAQVGYYWYIIPGSASRCWEPDAQHYINSHDWRGKSVPIFIGMLGIIQPVSCSWKSRKAPFLTFSTLIDKSCAV